MEGTKTAKEDVQKAMESINKVLSKIELDSAQEQTPPGPQKSINFGTKRLSIYLDDAINVLRSLQQGPSTKDSDLNRTEVQNIVKQALLSFKKNQRPLKKNPNKNRNQYEQPTRNADGKITKNTRNNETHSRKPYSARTVDLQTTFVEIYPAINLHTSRSSCMRGRKKKSPAWNWIRKTMTLKFPNQRVS